MNITIVTGRWIKDVDVRYTKGEKPICCVNGTLAVPKNYKVKEGEANCNFYDVQIFGKMAETVEKYARTKGTLICVMGTFENNNFTDSQNIKHYSMKLHAEKIELMPNKPSKESNTSEEDGFINVPSGLGDELPFA